MHITCFQLEKNFVEKFSFHKKDEELETKTRIPHLLHSYLNKVAI